MPHAPQQEKENQILRSQQIEQQAHNQCLGRKKIDNPTPQNSPPGNSSSAHAARTSHRQIDSHARQSYG